MQLASVALELATQKDDVMPFYEASVTAIYIHYTTIVTVAIWTVLLLSRWKILSKHILKFFGQGHTCKYLRS